MAWHQRQVIRIHPKIYTKIPFMSTRSVEMFGKSHEAGEKFDYFICGVSGALFAYIGQTYIPHKIDLSPSLLEPVSLIFLAVSFFSGLKRIETVNVCSRINHKILECSERAGNLTAQLASGAPGPFYNQDGGQIWSHSDLESHRLQNLKAVQDMDANLPKLRKRGLYLYKMRDNFLLLGFLAIFLSKVLQPYGNAPLIHKTIPASQSMPSSANQTKESP